MHNEVKVILVLFFNLIHFFQGGAKIRKEKFKNLESNEK